MIMLTRTGSSDENWDGDCSYAVITLSAADIRQIYRRRDALIAHSKKDEALSDYRFHDVHSVRYISGLMDVIGDADQDQILDGCVFPIMEEQATKLMKKVQRTDGERLVILESGFYFRANPRNCSVVIETEFFDYTTLAMVAASCKHCRKDKKDHAKGQCLFGSTHYEPWEKLK